MINLAAGIGAWFGRKALLCLLDNGKITFCYCCGAISANPTET